MEHATHSYGKESMRAVQLKLVSKAQRRDEMDQVGQNLLTLEKERRAGCVLWAALFDLTNKG